MSHSDGPLPPLLAIVPARGGSQGVRRKALRTVAGVPLILRTLRTISVAGVADRIVVSTEDAEIAAFVRLHGFEVHDRPVELAADDVPLAHVAWQAKHSLGWDGDMIMLQPTCPLLSPDTVRRFVDQFRECRFDWAIAATPSQHLLWRDGRPLSARVNRQQLGDRLMVESGAIQMWASDGPVSWDADAYRGLIPIPADEALDIDTYDDVAMAEQRLRRKRIMVRAVASEEKGSGHLWRQLRLSDALAGRHDVVWHPAGLDQWAVHIARQHGVRFADNSYVYPPADLVILDCIEAAETLVPHFKSKGCRTVVFEPDGADVAGADLVLDEFSDPIWTVLRSEFSSLPDREIRDDADRVLVTFGGTDPVGLNQRVGIMLQWKYDTRVAAGPLAEVEQLGKMEVLQDCSMAEQMLWADVVVTGQGRTVAEAAACGTPVISLAQNERESRHAKIPGVLYMGLWAAVSDDAVLRTVSRVLGSRRLREEMSASARAAVDGRGVDRVVHAIEGVLL